MSQEKEGCFARPEIWLGKSVAIFLLLSLFFCTISCTNQRAIRLKDPNLLMSVLKTSATYCRRLVQSTFSYECQEEIKEVTYYHHLNAGRISDPGKTGPQKGDVIKSWKYNYRLEYQDNVVREMRIRMEQDGAKVLSEEASLETQLYREKVILFDPSDLLSEFWQQHHKYQLLTENSYLGFPAYIIGAVPADKERASCDEFKIWIRASDGAVLRLERTTRCLEEGLPIEIIWEDYDVIPQITASTEYHLERNGILFPTLHRIEEAYLIFPGRRVPEAGGSQKSAIGDSSRAPKRIRFVRSETTVGFSEYGFHTVLVSNSQKEVSTFIAPPRLPWSPTPARSS